MGRIPGVIRSLALFVLLGSTSACSTEATLGTIGGATVTGAHAPSQEIEQIYYLGVFDPQEQLPSTVYRIRVRGQASAISMMKFSSGWVPAQVADSLNAEIGTDISGDGRFVTGAERGSQKNLADLSTGRRLVLFGPEGFREAPRNHRLAIVMGSSPEDYFNAIDKVLGTIDPSRQTLAGVRQQLFDQLVTLDEERAALRHDLGRLER